MTLQELFTKIESLTTAAQSKAADVLDQASATLRSWADWVEAQKAGLKFAGPADVARARELIAKCDECCKPEPNSPKEANGAILKLILAALSTFLQEFVDGQPS